MCLWQLFGTSVSVFMAVVWGTTRCVYTSCLGDHSVCLYQLFGAPLGVFIPVVWGYQSVCLYQLFEATVSVFTMVIRNVSQYA